MGQDKIQEEQLPGQGKKTETAPAEKKPSKGKFADIVLNVREMFAGPKGKGGKPPGGAKPAAGVKKPLISIPVFFSGKKVDLKLVNQALAVILAGLIVLVFYVVFSRRPDISSVEDAVSRIKFPEVGARAIADFQDISAYLDRVKARDIFNPYEEERPPVIVVAPPPPPPPPKVTIQEKARNLKLMGISWGSSPKAIIQDQSTQAMYFLSEGENVKGTDISIKKVLKDKVVIGSEGDEMTLL